MRKIKSYFFISLDGVVESPDKWHFPWFNDQMGAAIGAGAAGVGAYLMGRVLYEEWSAYWPEHADEPFGDVLNDGTRTRDLRRDRPVQARPAWAAPTQNYRLEQAFPRQRNRLRPATTGSHPARL